MPARPRRTMVRRKGMARTILASRLVTTPPPARPIRMIRGQQPTRRQVRLAMVRLAPRPRRTTLPTVARLPRPRRSRVTITPTVTTIRRRRRLPTPTPTGIKEARQATRTRRQPSIRTVPRTVTPPARRRLAQLRNRQRTATRRTLRLIARQPRRGIRPVHTMRPRQRPQRRAAIQPRPPQPQQQQHLRPRNRPLQVTVRRQPIHTPRLPARINQAALAARNSCRRRRHRPLR